MATRMHFAFDICMIPSREPLLSYIRVGLMSGYEDELE